MVVYRVTYPSCPGPRVIFWLYSSIRSISYSLLFFFISQYYLGLGGFFFSFSSSQALALALASLCFTSMNIYNLPYYLFFSRLLHNSALKGGQWELICCEVRFVFALMFIFGLEVEVEGEVKICVIGVMVPICL